MSHTTEQPGQNSNRHNVPKKKETFYLYHLIFWNIHASRALDRYYE